MRVNHRIEEYAPPALAAVCVLGAIGVHPERATDIATAFLWGAALVGGGMGGLFCAFVLVCFVVNRFRPVAVGAVPGARTRGQSRLLVVIAVGVVALLALVYATRGPEEMAYFAGYGPGLWVAVAVLRLVGRRATWVVRPPDPGTPEARRF